MGYRTNYKIFNTLDKTTVFCNKNTACFADWSGVPSKDKVKGFNKDWSMEVYATTSGMELKDHSLIPYWMDVLKDLGLNATYEKVDLKKYEGELPTGILKQEAWVWTFNFADYTSKAQLRFALYLMRYLYEVEMYKAVDKTRELSKDNPDIPLFELFQYVQIWGVCGPMTGGGHLLWYNRVFKRFITKSDLETYYKKWETAAKETYNEVHGMVADFEPYIQVYIPYNQPKDDKMEKSERNRIRRDKLMKGPLLTIEQYKEVLKEFEND